MHEPVLVLNANFEPLNVCQTRRAITLVLLGKASLVLNGRGVIHTVRRAYPRPSVIRLERMIRRPRPQVKLNRREIFRRDNYTCQYCGKTSHRLTVDHIVPRRLGGESTWENLVTACPICNHKKGGRTLQQARMRLLRPPQAPPSSAKYRFAHLLDRNREWEPFLDGW
jgi:5-methylcytosine-specific restriction endonuclease McrA